MDSKRGGEVRGVPSYRQRRHCSRSSGDWKGDWRKLDRELVAFRKASRE